MSEYDPFHDNWDDDGYDTSYAVRTARGSLGPFQGNISTNTITTKVPPMFDGSQSWFAYEKAIDEWVDLTELSEDKQGPALRARLEGEAARFKEFLDRDLLKQKNGLGVAYFKDTLRARILKSTQIVFLWRFLRFFEMHRKNEDFGPWLTKMALAYKKLKESWGDVFEPLTKDSPEFTAARLLSSRPSSAGSATTKAKAKPKPKAKAAAIAANGAGVDTPIPEDEEADATSFMDADLDDDDDEPSHDDNDEPDRRILRELNARFLKDHMRKFPLGDNLMGLMLVAMADLNEPQRLSFTSATVTQKLKIPRYTFENITEIFTELFCSNKTAFNNPFLNSRSSGRSFCIIEEGEYEDESGYWAIDEETQEEGFLPEYGETFWIYDGAAYYGRRLNHGRNLKKTGKGKGKFRSRFKARPGFKPKRRKPGKGRAYETEENIQEEDEENEEVTEDTVLAVKGKPKGKPKGNPKGSPPSDQPQDEKGGKKGRRNKSGKGKGNANMTEDVSNSFFVTEIYRQQSEQSHTLLSKAWVPLRERKENMINITEQPTYVILDIGCTRCMGSRKAVTAFLEAWKRKGYEAELLASNASFKFANSNASDARRSSGHGARCERAEKHRANDPPRGTVRTRVPRAQPRRSCPGCADNHDR